MAATRVQNVSAATGASATIAIGSAQGWVAPTAGNVLLGWYNGDNTVTTPTGFTASVSVVDGNGVYFWWKVAVGTETSVSFVQSANTTGMAGLIEYGGVAATPLDVANASPVTQGLGTSSPSVSATTTGTSGDVVVALAGLHGSNSGTAPASPSWTAGLTNIVALGSGTVSGSFSYSHAFVGDFLNQSPAGVIAPVCSWTNSISDRQALVISFKLAVAAPTAPPPGILFIGPCR